MEAVCTLSRPGPYDFDMRVQPLVTPTRFAHYANTAAFRDASEREASLLSYTDVFVDIAQACARRVERPCSFISSSQLFFPKSLRLLFPVLVTVSELAASVGRSTSDKVARVGISHQHSADAILFSSPFHVLQCIETLWFPSIGWLDEDVVVLAESLPLCRRVRCINLAGNAVSDAGVATLLGALPAGLEELDLSLTSIGDAGAALLSIRMPPGLRVLNLYETGASSAVRRACALKLSPAEMNGSGATRRLTKLVEPSTVLYSDPNGVGGMVSI